MSQTRQDSKPIRLRSTRDFREIYQDGQKVFGHHFLLFVRPREDGVVRFGVTASRRIGNAVVRNRAKRIMREAIRQSFSRINRGVDLVIVARTPILKVGMPTIMTKLVSQLQKLSYINEACPE